MAASSTTSTFIRRTALTVLLLALSRLCALQTGWLGTATTMTTVTTISTTDGSQQIPASTFGDEEHPTFADFEHYLVHIPKSGGSFVFDKLLDMTVDAPSWKEANQKSFWRTLLGDFVAVEPRQIQLSHAMLVRFKQNCSKRIILPIRECENIPSTNAICGWQNNRIPKRHATIIFLFAIPRLMSLVNTFIVEKV